MSTIPHKKIPAHTHHHQHHQHPRKTHVIGWPDWDIGVGAPKPATHIMANVGDLNEPIQGFMGDPSVKLCAYRR